MSDPYHYEVRALSVNLYQDAVKLFTSGKFSDVKIVCGNETFPCHKAVLAARSDVFEDMFDMTGSTENQEGVVQVDDFDARTMKSLLAYWPLFMEIKSLQVILTKICSWLRKSTILKIWWSVA
jgi:hypothetical protein